MVALKSLGKYPRHKGGNAEPVGLGKRFAFVKEAMPYTNPLWQQVLTRIPRSRTRLPAELAVQ